MSSIGDIYNKINEFAPFASAADFDNVGLLVGSCQKEVKKALICLDITSAVINEAVEKDCQLIISHHPVIFNPVKKIGEESPAYKLIENHIAALACHTNLDKAEKIGVNAALCSKLSLNNLRQTAEFLTEGEIEHTTALQFAEKIKEITGCDFLEAVLPENIDEYVIGTVGVSSGAGGEFVFETRADAFVTGEMKHHERLYAKEKGIAAFILGHYESETVYKESFRNFLAENLTDVEFIITEKETPPTTMI